MDSASVISWIAEEASKAMKKKTLPERFDHLYALTRAVDLRDDWISSASNGIKGALKSLGSSWKKVLLKVLNQPLSIKSTTFTKTNNHSV